MSIFMRNGDLKDYFKKAPATSIIILVNLFMLLVTFAYGGFDVYTLLKLGAIWAPLVENGEYWRLISGMFLHGSVIHFISNAVIGLYVLSSALERLVGTKKFLMIYFLSGIGSGILVVLTSNNVTIGASGAIFGALGSLVYLTIYRRDLISAQDSSSIRGLVLINIVFTFLMPGISIAGHIGGIVTGFILSYMFIKRNKIKQPETNIYETFDYTIKPEDYDAWDDEEDKHDRYS